MSVSFFSRPLGLRSVALPAFVLALSALAQPAMAQCCNDGPIVAPLATSTIRTAIQAAESTITGALTSSGNTISRALNSATQSIVAAEEKQIAAQKELAQAELNFSAASQAQNRFAKAQDNFNGPSAVGHKVCQTMLATQAAGAAADDARVNAKVLTKASTQRTLYTTSAPQAAREVLDDYNANYCTTQDQARGRCTAAADPSMRGAAISADSLLTPASNMTYSTQEIRAAQAYVTLVTEPVPTEMLPIAQEGTAAGKRFMLEHMSSTAQMSVAAHSLNQILASKSASADIGNTASVTASGDLSVAGRMKQFVEERFGDPAVKNTLAVLDIGPGLQELNLQMAASNWMGYHRYLQTERIEAVVATQLAIAARERADRQMKIARVLTTSRR